MNYPETKHKSVTDEYHGIQIEDPYRWLEEAKDPEVRAWTAAQNRLMRETLDAVPQRSAFYEQLQKIYGEASPEYYALQVRAGQIFAIKKQPPLQQPMLVALTSVDDPASERVILDPNQLDPSGNTAIDFYVAALDGKKAAISISKGGSERGDLYIYDTETRQPLSDIITRVQIPTGGGSFAWAENGDGLYYTRYPRIGERPEADLDFYQQIYFHKLGQPEREDTYVIGRDFPKIAECEMDTTTDGQYLLLMVKNGDGGEVAHHIRDPHDSWTQLTQFEDEAKDARLGEDQHLYLLSRQGAPLGKVLRIPLDKPDLHAAEVVVPEGSLSIQSFLPTQNYLYVAELNGGPSQLRVVDHQGQPIANVPVEPVSAVGNLVHEEADTVLFRESSFLNPSGWSRYSPATGIVQRTALFATSPADFGDCEVVREFATSRDGTRVPVNIIRRKGTKLDGTNPTLLYGYGGYGISLSPNFISGYRVWLDLGGVLVIANLRGGGEYGEAWHTAGNLTKKQNVFDDFIACAEYLVKTKYTSPQSLCIEGGSNGGLLMGAALTQRPDLFRAVVAHVGIYDMLRVELDSNGAFNVTEFGTVTNPQHFEALYDYSPYHRVTSGTNYPAVLFMAGENDGRVLAYHSRKMTALLQSASASKQPILLRTNTSGHGFGTALDEQVAEDADMFAFLASQLDHSSHGVEHP
ncbi:MAG TPA: prolyl oligopeptidase family serine peptidase [Anaerolineales bacterium]|nr:prolyl oligopeptidase family serine peptidase [Anaerolineales bacterium]